MRSLVRLAAMIPASCAVASASPLGNSRSRRAVSGAIRTTPRATARRRDSGLSPTSTMRTSPAAVTWLNSPMPSSILAPSRRSDAVERGQQHVGPSVEVVLAHISANGLEPLMPLAGVHRQGELDRLGLTLDVEGIDRHRPVAELRLRACVFR